MLTVDAVEQRFYQKTGVRDDEMVIIPFVNNDGSFGSRIEPAKVYYDMLKYVGTLNKCSIEEELPLFFYYVIVILIIKYKK